MEMAMSADLDERIEEQVSSAAAPLDVKTTGLNLPINPPSHDPPPATTTVGAAADCNGSSSITVHEDTKKEEEDEEVKDDTDASYVFVISDENDNNSKNQTHLHTAKTTTPNLLDPPPPTESKQEEEEEEQKPAIAHAFVTGEEITNAFPSPIHHEEKQVAASSDGTLIPSSKDDDDNLIIVAADHETKQVEDKNDEMIDEQSNLDSDGLATLGSHQPLITSADSDINYHQPLATCAEPLHSELHNQLMVEEGNKLEAASEIQQQEPSQVMVDEAAELNSHQTYDGEEQQAISDSLAETKYSLDPALTQHPDIVPELHQLDNGVENAKEEETSKVEDPMEESDENQNSQFAIGEQVSESQAHQLKPELHQLDHVEEREVVTLVNEISVDEHSQHREVVTLANEIPVVENSEQREAVTLDNGIPMEEHSELLTLTNEIPMEKHSELLTLTNEIPMEKHSELLTLTNEIPMEKHSEEDPEVLTEANTTPVEEHSELLTLLTNEIPMEKHSELLTLTNEIPMEKQSEEDPEVLTEADTTPVEEHSNHREVVTLAKEIPVEELSEHKEVANETLEEEHSVDQEAVQNSGVEIRNGHSDEMQVEAEDTNENSESIQCLPTCLAEQNDLPTELNNSVEGGESMSVSPPLGGMKSEPENDNEFVGNSNNMVHSADNVESVTEVGSTLVENGDSLPADHIDYKVSNGSLDRDLSVPNVYDEGIDSETPNGCGNLDAGESDVPADVVKIESEARNSCANLDDASVNDAPLDTEGGESATNKQEIGNVDVVDGGSKPKCVNKVIQDEADKSADDGNDVPISEEVTLNKGIESNRSATGSAEESATEAVEGPKVDDEVGKRPFYFLIRVPRYVDDNIRDQIKLAQQQVDERTQSRDTIRSTIQSRRAICSEYREKLEAARSEERAARDVLNAKRQELDAIQSVINRMKNENSIEDIDDRMHNMEHRIQHETMPLKEEKQLIREIKQLKNLREQLSSSLNRGAEAQLTLDERGKVEERFKLLKQELESARKEVLRTEAITRANRKIFFDENDKLKELQSQFRAADDFRQEAYVQMQNFKKQLYERNKYFRMYKDDVTRAEDYAFSGDREALQRLCVNQVETIMELWNRNDEFRNEYIRCNQMSTLRRLKTMDGRSLGPDEDPPVFRNAVDERVNDIPGPSANKIDSSLLVSSTEQEKPVVQDVKFVQKNSKANVKSVINLEQKNPTVKSKKESIPALLENGSATVSGREETEEKKQSKEEEELARKAEELRKEEAAAKLKEQRRLEEKAKAKEAEERKKRNAEKAQARAEIRARKEAEAKEKVREKRERKKEKKNAAAVEVTNGVIETESASSSETNLPDTTRELEIKDKPKMAAKRPKKPSVLAKQAKAIPPPLRNRGKRRMQQWMWIPLIILVIVILFLVGNSSYSFKLGLSSFGF